MKINLTHSSIVLCSLMLFATSCISNKPSRWPDVKVASYMSTFFGERERQIECELFAVLEEVGITPIHASVRATTPLVVRKEDYITALRALMKAAEQGRFQKGDVWLENRAFDYWDEKYKAYAYESGNTDITKGLIPTNASTTTNQSALRAD